MKSSLASLFSYLFMTAIIVVVISAFGAAIIGIRYFLTSISHTEKALGINFLTVLIVAGLLAPLLLHLSLKLERKDKIDEEHV